MRAIAESVLADSVALVAIEQGRLVGSLGLVRREWDWSGAFYLTDRWTFNEGPPEALRGLVEHARAIGRHLGLPLFLGYSGGRVDAAGRLYRSMGGEPAGALYRF